MEAFLLEMPIIGQHVRKAFTAHRLHGNTIGEAIALIRPGAVKIETCEKRATGLRDNADIRWRFPLPRVEHAFRIGPLSLPASSMRSASESLCMKN
jgi:hypothetical protein